MSRFSKEKESFLKTLTQFDGDTSEEDITGVCERKTGNSNTFIVHVLLESVLGLLEPDERKRQEMFIVACRYFYDLNLMDPEINLDNLIYPRRQMAFKFLNLFKKVQSELHPMPNNDHLLSIEYLNPSLCLETQKYRYEQNFEECEVIAKGGFGIVCKVRHNTDGIIYAVKKIIFKYKTDVDYQKVFREVKSISTLNHANIVSYNNAWIEPFNASTSSTESDESSSDSPNSKYNISSRSPKKSIKPKSVHTLNLPFNENLSSFSSSDSNGESFSVKKKQVKFRTTDIISEEFSKKSFCFDSTCTDDIVEFQSSNHSSSSTFSFSSEQSQKLVWNIKCMNVKVMLCIQMEFCDCDLRLWLDQRVKGDVLPFRMEVKDIFKDILQGVAYIHSKSIIHRDLKPQNIFFSQKDCVMKIGDFGLSTLFCASTEIHQSTLGQFSSDLGTIPYAAPEQRKKHTYDSKVDIYSLGIILIELLLHFGTQMEFCKTIEKIAAGNLPDELISKWPNYMNLVTNLIQTNPRLRLPAKEILKLPVLQENAEIDKSQLFSEIIILQERMERKDKELKEKDILIKNLKLEIRNQALMISKLKETLINKAP